MIFLCEVNPTLKKYTWLFTTSVFKCCFMKVNQTKDKMQDLTSSVLEQSKLTLQLKFIHVK